MSTEIKDLTMGVWIQISNGEAAATICHRKGGRVDFCQSATMPTERLHMGFITKEKPEFFTPGIAPEELWAYAHDIDTEITYTGAN